MIPLIQGLSSATVKFQKWLGQVTTCGPNVYGLMVWMQFDLKDVLDILQADQVSLSGRRFSPVGTEAPTREG